MGQLNVQSVEHIDIVSFVIDSVTKKQFYYVLCFSLRNCFEFELMIRHSFSKPDRAERAIQAKGKSYKTTKSN